VIKRHPYGAAPGLGMSTPEHGPVPTGPLGRQLKPPDELNVDPRRMTSTMESLAYTFSIWQKESF